MGRWWSARFFLVVIGMLPFIALIAPCRPLDAWFALHCHRIAERSFSIGATLLPVCARCLGLYLGVAIAGLAPFSIRERPRRAWMVAAGVAMLADVAREQLLGAPSAPLRLATGIALSLPIALGILSRLRILSPNPVSTTPRRSADV